MTSDQFRKAIRKGQGRAILQLMQGDPQPYLDEILYACLHNTTYDQQCEGTREDYLFEAINLSGRPDFIKSQVLERLLTATNERDTAQLFELARLFVERGDSFAREAIYKRFDSSCKHEKYPNGTYAIIALDRLDGLLHVMEQNGKRILNDPDFEPTVCSVYPEISGLSSLEVRRAVRMASKQNANLRACRSRIASFQRTLGKTLFRRRPKDYTLSEIKPIIEGEVPKPQGISLMYLLRSWAKHASKNDFHNAAIDFPGETDSVRIKRYLYLFAGRALPELTGRILDLALGDDAEIAQAAYRALENVKDNRVRDLALQRVADGKLNGLALSLLKHNYQMGDWKIIREALPADPDDEVAHDIGMGLRDIYEENSERDCDQLSHWLIEHNPCALCRHSAIQALVESGNAPPSLIEEAQHDCYSETRNLASATQSQS